MISRVLYVPRHWWHYVESVDPVTVSVNSWIELEEDDMARVSEAVTKAVVCALKSAPSDDNTDDWLNPTEERVASHNENMQYVNLAVGASAQRQRGLCQRDVRPAKRDSRGQIRKNKDSVPFSAPFGPHLIPVRCQQEDSPETRGLTTKDVEGSSDTAPTTELASAVRLQQGQRECSPGLTQCGPCDHADGTSESSSEDYEEPIHTTITTNDLLDCLVHPDIIAQVTQLLLERHTGNHRTTTPSSL